MSQQKGEEKQLIVASITGSRQFEYKNGPNKGSKGTMYDLAVCNARGEPIDAKFNCFKDVSSLLGKVATYTVTFRDHETYGRTYTLQPPRRDYAAELDALRERVERLESQASGAPAPSSTPAALPGLQSQTPAIPQQPTSAIGAEW